MSRGTMALMEWEHTVGDYVRLEAETEQKHEYYEGRIVAMGGGTIDHARLASRVGFLLGQQLDGKPCAVYSSDARVRVLATGLITYPDLSIGCGPVEVDVDDPLAQTNPTVLVEVTSPSSERHDRGTKLAHYKRILSVQEVVLVSHRERLIEVVRRCENGEWIVERGNAGERVQVVSIGCTLDVDAVYHDARSAS